MKVLDYVCGETGSAVSVPRSTDEEAVEAMLCPACGKLHTIDTASATVIRTVDTTVLHLKNYYMWKQQAIRRALF